MPARNGHRPRYPCPPTPPPPPPVCGPGLPCRQIYGAGGGIEFPKMIRDWRALIAWRGGAKLSSLGVE